jgi:hypothetical protein
MSRAGVKAQPAVRRAGPAPLPGGEDWWAEVEAVSKTAQGAARLNRDRLFHEKLLAALDAPVQAEVFEHAMLRKLGNALKTVANVCTHTMQPSEAAPVAPVSTGKQLPMASLTRKMVSLLALMLGERILSLMAPLAGKPPAKLTAELSRTLGLALRKLAGEGLSSLSDDLIKSFVALVPAAMRCPYETAAVVRMYALETLSFFAQQAGEQAQHASSLSFYQALLEDCGDGDAVSHMVQALVADGGAGLTVQVGGGETPHKAGQEIASAVQALGDLVHVSSASVYAFPVGQEGGLALRDASGEDAKHATLALEAALAATQRVYALLVQTKGALDAVLHRAQVSCILHLCIHPSCIHYIYIYIHPLHFYTHEYMYTYIRVCLCVCVCVCVCVCTWCCPGRRYRMGQWARGRHCKAAGGKTARQPR